MSFAYARPAMTGTAHPPILDQICQTLAGAPLGQCPVLEAAFGWHESRAIPGWHRPRLGGPPARDNTSYVPVTVTHLLAARRIARLLTTLTWPIARPLVEAGHDDRSPAVVEVPVEAYHRVSRAMAGAWRERWTDPSVQEEPSAIRQRAGAVWRMAVLIGSHHHAGGVAIRVRTPEGLRTLTTAARHLNLDSVVVHPSRRTVLLPDQGQSLDLLCRQP